MLPTLFVFFLDTQKVTVTIFRR